MDDIYKYLTMRITADDLTGGTWSEITKTIEDLTGKSSLLNQAWEIGSGVVGKLGSGFEKISEALAYGGDYNETKTAFEALSVSMKYNGENILKTLDEIAGGTLKIADLTKMAGNMMMQNYSESSIATIAAFSKRFTEIHEGDFQNVAETISKALITGKTSTLVSFGLVIDKSDTMKSALDKIDTALKNLGSGAYNFGDEMTAALNAIDNIKTDVSAEMNRLFADTDAGKWFAELKNAFWELRISMPLIAYEVFFPVYTSIEQILFKPIYTTVSMMFDMFFGKVEKLSTIVTLAAGIAGNVVLELAGFVGYVWNGLLQWPVMIAQQFEKVLLSLDTISVAGEKLFHFESAIEALSKYKNAMVDMSIDTDKLSERQKEYNNNIARMAIQTGFASAETTGFSDHLLKQREALEKVGARVKEHEKELKDIAKAEKDAARAQKEATEEAVSYSQRREDAERALKRNMADIASAHNLTMKKLAASEITEAKAHPEKLLQIQKEYAKKRAEEDQSFLLEKEKARTGNSRKLEDIEIEHQRKMEKLAEDQTTKTITAMKTHFDKIREFEIRYGTGLESAKVGKKGVFYDLTNQISDDTPTGKKAQARRSAAFRDDAAYITSVGSKGLALSLNLAGGSDPTRYLFEWLVKELNKAAIAQGTMVAGQ